MSRFMTRPAPRCAFLVSLLALLSLCASAVFAASPASAATTASLEGERMSVLSGRTGTFADSTASGGRALEMRTNGTASGTVVTPASTQLTLRLRGDQFNGAPRAVVRVDGRWVKAISVSATRWTDYVIAGSWSADRHTVSVSYTNDRFRSGVGDRNLRIDRVRFTGGTTAPSPAPSVNDAYETRIVELVNIERKKAGLRPVAVSACADRYAEEWSDHMATTGRFAHRSDLRAVMDACSARSIGENIAYGNVTADQMMRMWMESPGHRANILNAKFTHIGVGATKTSTGRVYGTQNFLTL
jgi:uncharacterized protein YkwD